MQEVLLVAVIQTVQQLSHDAGVVQFVKVHHSGLQQPHQIVIHVLEDQVEGSLVLSRITKPSLFESKRAKDANLPF